jgi:hypothetical protein
MIIFVYPTPPDWLIYGGLLFFAKSYIGQGYWIGFEICR